MDTQTDPEVMERLEKVCESDPNVAAAILRQRLIRASRPSRRLTIPGI
jgi:hypothetical protein